MAVFHKTRIGQALIWFISTAVFFTAIHFYLTEDGYITPLIRGVAIGAIFALLVFLFFDREPRNQQW